MNICNENTNSKVSSDFFISLFRIAENSPKAVKDSGHAEEESREGCQESLLHPEKMWEEQPPSS